MIASARLLHLFKRYFPAEFDAPVEQSAAARRQDVPEWITRFFQLIDQRLFPMPHIYFDDIEEIDGFLQSIPLCPVQEDWWNYDWEELPVFHQLALALLGEVSREEVLGALMGEERARPFLATGRRIRLATLKEMSEAAGGPIAHLELMLDFVCRQTGNQWIDLSQEEAYSYDYSWSEANIDELAAQYALAKGILDKVYGLDDFLKQDPANVEAVCRIWMAAAADGEETQVDAQGNDYSDAGPEQVAMAA